MIPAWCTSSSPEPATSGEPPQVCPPTCCDVRVIVIVVNIINVITIDIVVIATVLNISALNSFMVMVMCSGHIHLVMVARGTEPPYSWSNSEKNPFNVMMYIWSWLFWWWWWWCLVKCHTWGNIEAPLSFSFSLVMFECVQNLLIKLILFRELKMSATFSWFCQREEFCRTRRQPTYKMLSMNTSRTSQVLLLYALCTHW